MRTADVVEWLIQLCWLLVFLAVPALVVYFAWRTRPQEQPRKREPQTCPSRMNQLGPWERQENLDAWEPGCWFKDRPTVVALHKKEDDEDRKRAIAAGRDPERALAQRGPWNDLWLDDGLPPRTCSFCGCIHPDDAIKLLETGWWLQSTDKGYKHYMHPDSYRATFRIRRHYEPAPEPTWTPCPPVKLYADHVSPEHARRIDEILRSRKDG